MWAGRTICFNKKSEEGLLFALFSVGGAAPAMVSGFCPLIQGQGRWAAMGLRPYPNKGKWGRVCLLANWFSAACAENSNFRIPIIRAQLDCGTEKRSKLTPAFIMVS